MKSNRRMFGKTVVGAALVAPAIAAAYQSIADNQPTAAVPAAKPTVMVTVDLERLFHALPQWEENQAKVRALADKMEAERKAKDDEAKKLEQDLDLFPVDSPKHKEILDAFRRRSMEVSVYTEFIGYKLNEKAGESLRAMYQDLIQRALPAFAKAHGYNHILLNDNTRPLDSGNEAQVTQQISARRVLYADPAYDATDALIEWIKANPK